MKKYSDEELLEILRENPDLNRNEFTGRSDLPSATTYENHFGSWNEARKEAGIDLDREQRTKMMSDEELLDVLRENPDINQNELNNREDLPSSSAFLRRFGGLNEAKVKAGIKLEGRRKTRVMSDEELLDILRENPDVTQDELKESEDLPSCTVYQIRFGGLNEAKVKAGIKLEGRKKTRMMSDEELLDILRENPDITQDELRERDDLPHSSVYYDHFGSLNDARIKAGLEPRHGWECIEKEYTNQELLDIIRKNPDITQDELDERDDLPHSTIFCERFGGLNEAKVEAGIELEGRRKTRMMSDEELLDILRENPDVTQHELRESEDLPSCNVYQRRFGGLNEAKAKAGIEPRERGSWIESEYTNQELLNFLKENPDVTQEDLNEKDDFPSETPYARFGGLNEAKREAGVEVHEKTFPRAEYVDELDHFVRSTWERRFFIGLKSLNVDYEYESDDVSVLYEGGHVYHPDALVMWEEWDFVLEIKHDRRIDTENVVKMRKCQEKFERPFVILGGTERLVDICDVWIPWRKIDEKGLDGVLSEISEKLEDFDNGKDFSSSYDKNREN